MMETTLPTKKRIKEVFKEIEILRAELGPSFYQVDKVLEKAEHTLLAMETSD